MIFALTISLMIKILSKLKILKLKIFEYKLTQVSKNLKLKTMS